MREIIATFLIGCCLIGLGFIIGLNWDREYPVVCPAEDEVMVTRREGPGRWVAAQCRNFDDLMLEAGWVPRG
jgi:hypothetical protein